MILCIAQTSENKLASVWDLGHGWSVSSVALSLAYAAPSTWIFWEQRYKVGQLAISRLNQFFVPDGSSNVTFHTLSWERSWTGHWGIKQSWIKLVHYSEDNKQGSMPNSAPSALLANVNLAALRMTTLGRPQPFGMQHWPIQSGTCWMEN